MHIMYVTCVTWLFYSFQESNAILFVFQISFCQKLKLTITSDLNNVLSAIKVVTSNTVVTHDDVFLLEKAGELLANMHILLEKNVKENWKRSITTNQ